MTKKPRSRSARKVGKKTKKAQVTPERAKPRSPGEDFDQVLALIESARRRAHQAVNTELVSLYWQLGEYISEKIESAEWGEGVVDELTAEIARRYPGLRGFRRRNLFRMVQFYQTYRGDEIVPSVMAQLSWTHHITIFSHARQPEERRFYMLAAIKEGWSTRELERQIRSGAALRLESPDKKLSATLKQIHPTADTELKDRYSLEFLGLSAGHSEADLHSALLDNLSRFITELGRDFCFVGSEYPVQVGNQDFAIDLLFFHRQLACLVAIELKVREFRPEDLGKLSFSSADRFGRRRETRSCVARRAPEERAPERYSQYREERRDEAARRSPQMRVAAGEPSRSAL